jgi:hypothetical protein
MKRTAKLFLIGSVTLFTLGLTGPGAAFMWGILKPLGALLFGAFFITNLVATEYAQYDEEQKRKQPVRSKATHGKSSERLEESRLLAPATVR